MKSGLRVLVKDRTWKADCFSQVQSRQVHPADRMIFQNTKHIIFLPWLKSLKEFPQFASSPNAPAWGKALHNRISVNLHSNPQTPQAQIPGLGLSNHGKFTNKQTLTSSHLPCLPTSLLTPPSSPHHYPVCHLFPLSSFVTTFVGKLPDSQPFSSSGWFGSPP